MGRRVARFLGIVAVCSTLWAGRGGFGGGFHACSLSCSDDDTYKDVLLVVEEQSDFFEEKCPRGPDHH